MPPGQMAGRRAAGWRPKYGRAADPRAGGRRRSWL